MQRAIPAVFMRGGTSKAIMFHARDLPADRAAWDALFTAAMGTPDPYGRQLDGMGGGVSSLSKVCVLAPATRPDADLDYTFAQVQIREDRVDHAGNCGNMSAAVGPFAVDEGLVGVDGDVATIRIHNTNTRKIIRATFPVDRGRARYDGDLAIPGVAGTGAPVRLDFLEPGGATTGRLLPSGRALDRLDVPGFGPVEASLVDAGNAAVFVRARDVGLTGAELPDALDADPAALRLLDDIRVAGSVRMGIAPDAAAARALRVVPFVGVVGPAADAPTLTGEGIRAGQIDLAARVISNGQPHRALPLTVSLCIAVAARIAGTLVAEALSPAAGDGALRLGMPSGVLTVGADVAREDGAWIARAGSFYRTARRLFDGRVWVPVPPGR
ncbi:3-methylitaconate isomerase [Methylobacterium crusticola]|uniref:3-methylitaconate isomerase n=1 Tax=Methylobacterium crusticola TaxID=1697972 RepID=A0ABQ4R5P5_9HYPH|nr:PrpF domain-containing protein [Methylobacterium crusticola]GJD53011.1 3-methylitaconate isomerase [Methylobacterium crusticola]